MQVLTQTEALREVLRNQDSVALVPTMGNLHAGHLHLVDIARGQAAFTVASIFVNPLQFGANEDLANYPRTLDQDLEKLEACGTDLVFTPEVNEMYPVPQQCLVTPPPIASELCGAARPGHFQGVATVVLKLFNLVQPDVAVFGSKDFQQLFIIREMVRQLNLPIRIVAGETVREADGLAMSSRNGYLKPAERVEAPRLYRTLQQMVLSAQQAKLEHAAIETQSAAYLTQLGWIVDYLTIRSAATLQAPVAEDRQLVALGAARLGKTRLIDNIEFAL